MEKELEKIVKKVIETLKKDNQNIPEEATIRENILAGGTWVQFLLWFSDEDLVDEINDFQKKYELGKEERKEFRLVRSIDEGKDIYTACFGENANLEVLDVFHNRDYALDDVLENYRSGVVRDLGDGTKVFKAYAIKEVTVDENGKIISNGDLTIAKMKD